MDRQPRYRVSLGPDISAAPWLLKSFGAWLSTQAYGAVGCFAIDVRARPDEHALIFAALPNDRELAIDARTNAIVLRWATGKREVASSFAVFLTALSESNTGIIALDVGDRAARAELVRWLRLNNPALRASSLKIKRDTEPNQTATSR